MIPKLPTFKKIRTISFLLIFYLFLTSTNTNAQCAGVDNDFEVCDIANPSSKTIDLFSQLAGTPSTGGTWEDLDFVALSNPFKPVFNNSTGILNVQLIPSSGIYHFKYSVPGCTDTAIVTVTVGGYSGTPAPTATVCSVDAPYNLFQTFNGAAISPQLNGTWSDDDASGGLVDEFFNPLAVPAIEATYSFTYTIPSIGGCSSPTPAKIKLTVIRAPNAGNPVDLAVCSDNLNLYTNLNLFDYVTGEDPGGTWTEGTTRELTSLRDAEISLKNIYENFGEGSYRFTYTVNSPTAICKKQTTVVTFCIESKIDFSAAILNVTPSATCANDLTTTSYIATLNQNQSATSYGADGDYEINYEIVNGAITTTKTQIIHFYRSSVNPFTKGITTFPIDASYFSSVGNYTINIKSITRKYLAAGTYHGVEHVNNETNICFGITTVNLSLCTTTINVTTNHIIRPIPKIVALVINPVCKGADAIVALSGTDLIDGDSYEINYTLSGSNSQIVNNFAITIAGSKSEFSISNNLIPTVGTTTITITTITNITTGCTSTPDFSKDFIVKPEINLSDLIITVADVCLGNDVQVKLKGLNSFSKITLDYDVTGVNTIASESGVFTIVDGAVAIVIPASSLTTTGMNTLHVTKFTDVVTGCELILSNDTNFNVNEIPLIPIVMDEVSYCKDENKTVADLLPNGPSYKWFISATSTTALNNADILGSSNYYVNETSPSGCVSDKAVVTVTINDSNAPILLDERTGLFCGLDKPTLQDLDNNIDKSVIGVTTLVYFDALNGGSELSLLEPLVDKKTYYAFTFVSTTGCYSSNALAVEVSLYDCDAVKYDFFIPDGFSPNGDMVNDTFNIPNIDLIFPNFTLEIYNRYGNLMFSGNKSKPSWDGKNSDHSTIDGIAPNGVYFYVINFNKDNAKPKQGRLYLNR